MLMAVGIVLGTLFALIKQPPSEKRTYLFETETGERYNPFNSVAEGAEDKENQEYKYQPSRFD